MHMVDDATAQAMGRFSAEETTWAAAGLLRRWIERYGIPQALYTDWKNVYVRPPNAGERMRGEAAVTQFGRMCARLSIRIIAASSPQAKGRVERAHGTHQDRLVKKLRLARSRTTSGLTHIWTSIISPTTTCVTRARRRRKPTITDDAPRRGNWTKCFGWRSNAW
jgi:hypothetical protein